MKIILRKFTICILFLLVLYWISTTQVVQENAIIPFKELNSKLQLAYIGLFGVILGQILGHYFSKSREYEKKFIEIFEKLYAPYILDVYEHVEKLEKEYRRKSNRLRVILDVDLFENMEKDLDSIINNIRENTSYMTPKLLYIYFQVNRELKRVEEDYDYAYNNELLKAIDENHGRRNEIERKLKYLRRKKMILQYQLLIVYLKQFKITTRKASLLSISLSRQLNKFIKILCVHHIQVYRLHGMDMSFFEKSRYIIQLLFISPSAVFKKNFYDEEKKEKEKKDTLKG